mgnify:CR=1 FL=1
MVTHKKVIADDKIRAFLRTAALSQDTRVKMLGSTWGVFSPWREFAIVADSVTLEGKDKIGAVAVFLNLDSIYEVIKKDQKLVVFYLLLNIVLLTIVGLFRMIRLTVSPIERMARVSGSFQGRAPVAFHGSDDKSELGLLKNSLNSMLVQIEMDREKLRKTVVSLEESNHELKRTQLEMVRAEKLASVGRLSAGLAHEIGNPLGIVQGYIELLQQPDLTEEQRGQFVQRAQKELDRVSSLIRKLLDFARTSDRKMGKVVIDSRFISEIIELITIQKGSGKSVSIEKDIENDLAVIGDEESLKQVLLNCLINAVDAITMKKDCERGKINIIAQLVTSSGDAFERFVQIDIADNGIGISDEMMEMVFDPFYTTKEPGKGTGLGLFVSHNIIESHGGRMSFETDADEGVTVRILLPADDTGN